MPPFSLCTSSPRITIRASWLIRRSITADTALRLGRYFRMAPEFWLNLQSHYDLEQAQEKLAGRLDNEVKVLAAV